MYDKPSTYEKKCNIFRNHITEHFKKFRIRDITKKEVAEFRNLLAQQDISNNYKRYILTALKTFFNYCMKQELIYKNPSITIDNFKKEKVTMKFWTINEFKGFIENVDNKIYYTLFYLMYFTGIRSGEALALTWNDIDLKKKWIKINKSCSYIVRIGYVISKPKTESSIRHVMINNKLVDNLASYKEKCRNDFVHFDDASYVFSYNNDIFAKTKIDRKFTEYTKKANLPKIRIHDLGHSHVALLIHTKEDILAIKKRLGHTDVGITLNVYGHLYDSKDREIADKLDYII
ncbi:MAG: tyrosine-type recombinase/integrase [Bacilli bacterium]